MRRSVVGLACRSSFRSKLRRLRIGGQPLERRQREPRLSERHHRQLHLQPPVPPDGGAFETVVASWNASSKADSLLYGC